MLHGSHVTIVASKAYEQALNDKQTYCGEEGGYEIDSTWQDTALLVMLARNGFSQDSRWVRSNVHGGN